MRAVRCLTSKVRIDRNRPDSAYHGMVDALGISLVALVVTNKRLNKLEIHQTDSMAKCLQLTSPVLGATACFHANKTFAAIGKPLQHLCRTRPWVFRRFLTLHGLDA